MTFTCDTSVLVPALAPWHPQSTDSRAILDEHDVRALPAHVLLECYSVLTRLPHDRRVPPSIAATALELLRMGTLTLPGDEYLKVPMTLAAHGVRGGAVFDGLIGATAAHHGLTLLTRDVRAERTYRVLGVDFAIV